MVERGSRRAQRRTRRRRQAAIIAGSIVVGGACIGGAIAAGVFGAAEQPVRAQRPSATEPSLATTTVQEPTTTTTAPQVGPLAVLAGKVVLVDPGHNGRNFQHPEINEPVDIRTQVRACDTTGAQTDDGYTESAFNMDLSLRVADLLRAAGATAVLTRPDNEGWGPCINQRAAIGNDARADVGISIHADGGPPTGRGFHLIYPESIPGLTEPIAADSYRLALVLRDAFGAGTGTSVANYIASEGLDERRDLGGLNLSTIPKVFLETANMRNAEDAALLKDEAFRRRAAESIVQGLAAYFAA